MDRPDPVLTAPSSQTARKGLWTKLAAGQGALARRQQNAEPAAQRASDERARDLRVVRRIHLLRTLGLGLGFFCVASVLQLHGEPAGWWILLALNAFAWSHVAKMLALRSANPLRTEFRNLVVDSALGGVWIAVMQFNLLPSVLLVTMLSVDKVSAGGGRLLLRASVTLVTACLLTATALGFPVDLATPMIVVAACMPFLVAYPLAISIVTYGLATKVARQNRRLLEISRTDELTGLGNRRHCRSVAAYELDRHRRSARPALLIVLDIDRFKSVNDRYGHPMGDELLRRVTGILGDCTRATDTLARYAGDEFMIVMPETDLDGGEDAARRIRERVSSMVLERAPELRCTVSIGAAEAHDEMEDVEDWIQQADAALYRAKAAGRDCYVASPSTYRSDADRKAAGQAASISTSVTPAA